MTKIKGGCYLKARKIQESAISRAAPYVREIWDWVLKEANYRDTHVCKRGQTLRTFKDIQEGLSWYAGWRKSTYSKDQCEKAMAWLREATMVATEKTTRGLLITVLNYDYYQDLANYESDDESNRTATRKQHPAATINKKENKDKEREEEQQATVATVVAGDGVNQVMQVFYETVNPTIKFANTTQRKAAQNLIDRFGLEAVLKFAKYASSVHGKPYAPRIATPTQLEDKFADLKAYYQSNTKSSQSKVLEV